MTINLQSLTLATIDICTQTDDYILQDGFKSFPSGHSSGMLRHMLIDEFANKQQSRLLVCSTSRSTSPQSYTFWTPRVRFGGRLSSWFQPSVLP